MKLIPLSAARNSKNKGKYFAKVDDEDYDFLMQWHWTCCISKRTQYAYRFGGVGNPRIMMHRVILKISNPKIDGDHINHDGLDNQKFNLRSVSRAQNTRNKTSMKGSISKYVGVSMKGGNRRKKWFAQIAGNGGHKHLGYFEREDDAAKAYDIEAKNRYGEFANLNFK